MADLDLARVKRNVAKMAAQNAPEADIDGYIASEGTTVEAVRTFRSAVASSEASTPSYGGAAMNATAGVNESIYGALGTPVDLMRGAMNLGISGINAATGSDISAIPDDNFGGSKSIASMMGAVAPQLDPTNTIAADDSDRIARGIGQGVGYTIAPEAAVAGLASRGVGAGSKTMEAALNTFGRGSSVGSVAANAAIGAASGGGAAAAMEAAPEPYKPLAGLLGGLGAGGAAAVAGTVPGLAREGARIASDVAAPLTATGRERLAGTRIADSATDAQALREKLSVDAPLLVPGSKPTTFQVTGDMGVGAMERGAAVKRPDEFNQRRADQNQARVSSLSGIETKGAAENVSKAIRDRLAAIDAETSNALSEAHRAAQTSVGGLGSGLTPENAGDALRGSLEAARAKAKDAERSLWGAVDPDGSLALPADNVRQMAISLVKENPMSAKPIAGEEASILGVVGAYRDVVPFREMTALQSRLKSEMRAEHLANGDTAAYRRMTQLNGAIQNDLETAVAGKVQQEAQAVAAGNMSEENTLLARAQQWSDDWYARQAKARSVNSVGDRSNAGIGQASFLGSRGTASEARNGSRNAPGGSGLPANDLEPNFSDEALGRLNTARDATRQRVETFDNKQLAPMRARPTTTAPYNMRSSQVASNIFMPGPKGFEAIQSYRKAVGDPEAMSALQGYAVDRLRTAAMREDGTLDPNKVAAWRRGHSDALRAFPELDSKFADAAKASDAMAEVGRSRKAALDEAQAGAFGKLIGAEDPSDVTRIIGGLFQRQDAVNQMARVRRQVRGNENAEQGLRKAVVDHMVKTFVGNTEAGTSGTGTMKSDAFQTFVKKNGPSLHAAGFNSDELQLMGRIAEDLQRSNRSVASVKNPGGSNTAQDTFQVDKSDSGKTVLAKVIAQLGAPGAGAGAGFAVGGGLGAAAGAVGAGYLAEMRRQGLEKVDDLIADALLNPGRARVLLAKVHTPAQEDSALKTLADLYRRSALPTTAVAIDQNAGAE